MEGARASTVCFACIGRTRRYGETQRVRSAARGVPRIFATLMSPRVYELSGSRSERRVRGNWLHHEGLCAHGAFAKERGRAISRPSIGMPLVQWKVRFPLDMQLLWLCITRVSCRCFRLAGLKVGVCRGRSFLRRDSRNIDSRSDPWPAFCGGSRLESSRIPRA